MLSARHKHSVLGSIEGRGGKEEDGGRRNIDPESRILHVLLPLVQGSGVADSLACEIGFRPSPATTRGREGRLETKVRV
jgi:hypothetical protein